MLQTMPHPNGAVEAGVPSIEVRAAHAADRLGVAPDAVERLPFDLSVLDSDAIRSARKSCRSSKAVRPRIRVSVTAT